MSENLYISRLDSSLVARVRRIAFSQGVTLREIVSKALSQYVDSIERRRRK